MASARDLYDAAKRAGRVWRSRPNGYEEMKAAWSAYSSLGEVARQRLPFKTSVLYAYAGGSQTATNGGGYHITVLEPVTLGRLRRDAGDALCKPYRKFWGLEKINDSDKADCLRCLEMAERLASHG